MERYIPVALTQRFIIVLVSRIQKIGDKLILSKWKGDIFGPTYRNDRPAQSGPPSKLVPNISVGPKSKGPFHLMYRSKFPEF